MHLRIPSFRTVLAAGLLLGTAGLPGATMADPHDHSDRRDHHGGRGDHDGRADHDAVRAAVEQGEIKPLADLLAMVKDKLPGEITGVEVERKHDQWMYEFRVIAKDGRLFKVYVDAKSGDIRRTKEK
ncbi:MULTISPECIES: PepSY domain-containing protein [Rhodopseudomonas]|uniref:Peptidase n=1 Tax=Rhodopseudomonas palustris TaxID=1076 RepID=A0A0D7EZB1_RHOPL|nr:MULTISPECIES: PepSY domain-containing protein [Rhodopseudomonas]KIZ45875.1 peptidase [Rhodopseudomonas palustris]MDF3813904.1 PepSY domain-containing protein [Rhodopseudomonas sp. BAL398]WOK16165.1 PepSY domain-containing protein [Rhodopseudomonas sp. BAL398]